MMFLPSRDDWSTDGKSEKACRRQLQADAGTSSADYGMRMPITLDQADAPARLVALTR